MELETILLTTYEELRAEMDYHANGGSGGKYSRSGTRLHLSQKHAHSLEDQGAKDENGSDNEIKKLKEEINMLREANHQTNEKHMRLTHANAQLRERVEQSEGLVAQSIFKLLSILTQMDGALEMMARMHGRLRLYNSR
ncbi:hypothetical protein DH2020_033804 [Rehmannia glutinosa]|uniref:Uncharacterized protein n=1 Tax=Rehmannia glutinosa TaxID=99300 RepID=A0ABR0VEE2_REHGL